MDFEDITLGEIEDIEEYAGLPISSIASNEPGVIKLRVALAWILKRRIDPNFTIDDARKLSTKQLGELLEEDSLEKKG